MPILSTSAARPLPHSQASTLTPGIYTTDPSQRDTLDQEIERCVCGLFERLKLLEGANEQLRSKLTEAGISMPDGLAMSGLSGGMSGDVNVLSLQSRDE